MGAEQGAIKPRSLKIPSRRGRLLAACLHGSYKEHPVLVIAHGMMSSKSSPRHILMAREAVRHGFAVLRFDFAGRGNSQGSWQDLTPQGELADLLGVIDYLRQRTGQPIFLYGSSLGGWAVLRAAGLVPVAGVVTWAAVADFAKLSILSNKPLLALWERQGYIDFQGSKLPYAFFTGAMAESPSWSRPGCPCYVAHGSADEIVPFASARDMALSLPNCQFREIPGGDHRLLAEPARSDLINEMVVWLAGEALKMQESK